MFVLSLQHHESSSVGGRPLLEKLVRLGARVDEFKPYVPLFVLTYAFLLRMPSEALPVRAITGAAHLEICGEEIVLHLSRRKNRAGGSRITRRCWCAASPSTCPVHVLATICDNTKSGELMFPDITAARALHALRTMLTSLRVPNASRYRTHDFRRGHAKDLQLAGTCYTLRLVITCLVFYIVCQ